MKRVMLGVSLDEKSIGDNKRCANCEVKGAVLCTTCSGSGLYVDSILESQGIIVKVRCLGKYSSSKHFWRLNVVCSSKHGCWFAIITLFRFPKFHLEVLFTQLSTYRSIIIRYSLICVRMWFSWLLKHADMT